MITKTLSEVNPKLAKQWHISKNGSLAPMDLGPGSGKKVWWLCQKGHEWQATVNNRSSGSNCPFCSGRRVCKDNSLKYIKPNLANEWHPKKNGILTPEDVTLFSHKKVWWICKKGHEWEASIAKRSIGRGCHYCSNRAVNEDNCLKTINPNLSKEWHLIKNGLLTPDDVTPSSPKKVWWACSRGHEWQAVIASRNSGRGCPYCHSQTSQLELRIYSEMKYLFEQVEHRASMHGFECDIYIPKVKCAIEIDGLYWHKGKYLFDKTKTYELGKYGINMIRVRELGLRRILENDVVFSNKDKEFMIINNILNNLLLINVMSNNMKSKINSYIRKGSIANNREYLNLLDRLPSPLPGSSLLDRNPKLSIEWHPTRNGKLTPRDVGHSSNKKVWWLCQKGHEWQSIIANRTKKRGCPYCGKKLVYKEYNLKVILPLLSQEWHLAKNGILTPEDIMPFSHKKVWWICKRGHEWQARVANRSINKRGCPYCSNQIVYSGNCLSTINPKLAGEWHPNKNRNLTPMNVTAGTTKKVWWLCSNGHEYQATVNHRNNGTGCPYCYKMKRKNR